MDAGRLAPLAPWLAPLLLLGVGLNQVRLVHQEHLSPWLGGGFGMFSTTDNGSNRHLRAFAIRGGREWEIRPPGPLGDVERRARVHPTDANLERLVLRLIDTGSVPWPLPEAVRVEVWRARLAPETLAAHSELLRGHRVELRRGP